MSPVFVVSIRYLLYFEVTSYSSIPSSYRGRFPLGPRVKEETCDWWCSGELDSRAARSWKRRWGAQPLLLPRDTLLDWLANRGWEEAAEGAIEGWLCRGCDTVVSPDAQECPQCGMLRSAQPPDSASHSMTNREVMQAGQIALLAAAVHAKLGMKQSA